MMLGDKRYLSAQVQQNLFDFANISLEVPYRLNQKMETTFLVLQAIPQTHRNNILPTQRQYNDDAELRKAILRTFYSDCK